MIVSITNVSSSQWPIEFPVTVGEVIINKSVWNKLSPDLQEIIRTAAMASMTETYTYNVYRNAQAIVLLPGGVRTGAADPRGEGAAVAEDQP